MAMSLERVQQFFDDPPASGGSPFTIVGHTNVSVVGTGPVSFSLNTTGIGLLVVSESYVQVNGITDSDPSDGVNTYIPLNGIGSSSGLATNQMFYVVNPTGGNITISATHNTTTLCAEWYSVSGGTATLDQQAPGGTVANTQTSISPGNIVNSADRLFITGVSAIVAADFSSPPIDSSFIATSATNVVDSGGFSAGMAHKKSSTDENPAWSFQGTIFAGSTMANFNVGSAGALATDNFTRANADPISNPMSDGVSTWTSMSARWSTLKIAANAVTKTIGGLPTGAAKIATPTFNANQTNTITIGANMSHGAGVRAQSGSGSGYLLVTFDSNTLALYREDDNGTAVSDNLLTFADPGPTFTAGDTISCSISNTTLRVSYNGTYISAMTTTDTTYATGQPWIREQVSSTTTLMQSKSP